MIKQIGELKNGDCQVLTKDTFGEKTFSGTYSESYRCVFFAIPSTCEIIGYYQD